MVAPWSYSHGADLSFYSRGYGGLVRFPGLGGFGDAAAAQEMVSIAQEAVNAATDKLKRLQTERANQVKLIDFTIQAQKDCTDPGKDAGKTAAAFFTAGASVAVCLAEQSTALGQRRGVLGQLDLQIGTLKSELQIAKDALKRAKEQAVIVESLPPEEVFVPTAGGGSISAGAGGSSSGSSGGGGGIKSMLTNPLVLGGGALVVILGAFMLTRKSSSVAGYRRRRR